MGQGARFPLGLLGIGLAGLVLACAPPAASGNPVSGLPHAQGQSFETLDAYLAHLERLGTIGIAWYDLMPDGRYQLVMRRPPGAEPRVFTRQDLAARFGFDE